jgi:ATP-dependent helicase/nuclease subunit B
MENRSGVPVDLELSFGEEPAPLIEMVLARGRRIRLRGRIDRVDRLTNGDYEVIDYKTGSLYRDRYGKTFAQGRLLQHALYAYAARSTLANGNGPVNVARSTYYFITEKGSGERVVKPGNLNAAPVVRDIADAIGAGAFIRPGQDSDCRYCDYARACDGKAVEQASVKREKATHPGLVALGRLANYD